MWILYSIIANITIIYIEWSYRTSYHGNFVDGLPYMIVPILVAQFCLFNLFKGAPHYMIAWIVFTVGNSILRVTSNHYILKEDLSWVGFVGVGTIILGALLVKEGTIR